MTLPTLAISDRKIKDYLLNPSHTVGGSKAKFFLAHGFTAADPALIGAALVEHAWAAWPGTPIPTPWGMRHEITGPMEFPDGSFRDVLSVWQFPPGETAAASFITAYPRQTGRP